MLFQIRGYLLHITHYDPRWFLLKKKEKPFQILTAKNIIKVLSEEGFNTIIIDIADGICYKKHPELRKHYSQSKDILLDLVTFCRSKKFEVIPKLNFSRSEINTHNHWMRRKNQKWYEEFDDKYYFEKAFDCIDEVIETVKSERFFHVGMDEDHDRSIEQYVNALMTFRNGLKKRNLTMVAWSDSAVDYPSGALYREKSKAAEERLPKDTVRLLWNYWGCPENEIKEISKKGFQLWIAPGWQKKTQILKFRNAALKYNAKGIVMTRWLPCIKENEKKFIAQIRNFGYIFCK